MVKIGDTSISARAGSRSITRSPAQKSACKDLSRNGKSTAITSEATYTPTSTRAGSRSLYFRRWLL
ncbi:ATP-dependent nuclease subunit B [Lacticaseibacillus rhamnosus]|nr:ATP-dependent nuclease subunit B [Lacticaseibacillus rhamnosus]MCT3371217.1 ATP-dependent nuclease subunit B [Lacticaseibacillus rhamnosus]